MQSATPDAVDLTQETDATPSEYGETDEFGFEAVPDRVQLHDLHATILQLMGLDHELLTYFHQGREESLTDVGGRVVTEILA